MKPLSAIALAVWFAGLGSNAVAGEFCLEGLRDVDRDRNGGREKVLVLDDVTGIQYSRISWLCSSEKVPKKDPAQRAPTFSGFSFEPTLPTTDAFHPYIIKEFEDDKHISFYFQMPEKAYYVTDNGTLTSFTPNYCMVSAETAHVAGRNLEPCVAHTTY